MGDGVGPCEKLCRLMRLKNVKPYLAVVSLQFGYAGLCIIAKISLNHGFSHFILSVYRHVVATLVMAPFAFFLERKIRPKMTLPIFLRIAALGFLEPVLDQNLYYLGMKYTTATYASAVINVLPALTFIMALIFRLETVNVKNVRSLAKVAGTVVTVTGAMVMTLYKGPIVDLMKSSHHHGSGEVVASGSADQHWVKGTLMLLASCCCWSGFIILQSFTLKAYPAELSLTALICLTGMVEGSIATLILERDMSVWVIGWDSKLLAVVYSGVICSGGAYYLQGVAIRERGPVFATSFSPLCMIITAALGSIFLAEKLHLGSIIGATIIVFGLYTVIWGKSKDHKAFSMSADQLITNEKFATALHELPITGTHSPENGRKASEPQDVERTTISSGKDGLP